MLIWQYKIQLMHLIINGNVVHLMIDKIVYEQMGDTKINLSSPEQLSWLIYSVKPKDKKEWSKIFIF